ncbi:MAG: ArsR/SmtB family transcription factor [Sphingomonadales bacterium]
MNDELIPQVADTFKLMGDPSRLAILMLCLHGQVAVGEIALKLSLSPSLVSHHLRLLRAARLVRAERRGKQVFYEAEDHHIRCIVADMMEHAAEEAGTLTGRSAA